MKNKNGWFKRALRVGAVAGIGVCAATANAAVTNITVLDNVMDTAADYYNSAVAIGLGVILIGTVVGFLFKGLFLRKR